MDNHGNSAASRGGPNHQHHHTNISKSDLALNQSKDAQTMINVLKDMGIEEFEPRVINQLMEFSYRYIICLLEDAKAFSVHAGKKTIDSDDIKMAIKTKVDYSFTTTPPRDLLIDISKSKNKHPLPIIKYHSGIRLPPDRFCLHAQNYALKSSPPPQSQQQQQAAYAAAMQQRQSNGSNNTRNTAIISEQQQQQQQDSFLFCSNGGSSNNPMPAKRRRDDENDEDYDV